MILKKIVLALIIILAIFFRFNNLNWDNNFHLHPDERFLTMVGNAMVTPLSFKDYLDPHFSSFNPANIGYKFYVYGIFPIVMNKIVAIGLENDNYNLFTIQGRFLSALFDILTLLFVYKIAKIFEEKFKWSSSIKYWSAFFYAIAALPIQLAHFFTVDTFLNFFMIGSFYFTLRASQQSRELPEFRSLIAGALFFGLALACKITAVFILPLNIFFIVNIKNQKLKIKNTYQISKIFSFISILLLYVFIAYLSLRVFNPYYFQAVNFFDPTPNKLLVENLRSLKSFESKDIWYPPGVQWINKPAVIFSLINLSVFGLGIPSFILVIVGMLWIILNIKYKKLKIKLNIQNLELLVILVWVIIFFLYQSTRFAQTMRYYIFIYPFLAIFAAIGTEKIRKSFIFYLLFFILLSLWPVMFSSIYLHKNSRVEASEWIYQKLETGSLILGEYWDDPLPLPVVKNSKQFRVERLPVFDPDTPEKWQKMNALLKQADYYILSSNRGWGNIMDTPMKYPLTSKFYKDLFDGKSQYKKIIEFTAYPKFSVFSFQFSLNDQWADESFTVYDHPKVMIFKNLSSSRKEI